MLVFTTLETFAIGWIDVTYNFKYGCFVTMMTGNVINMGKTMALEGFNFAGAAFYLGLIFTFWCGVFSFRVLDEKSGHSKRSIIAMFLAYYLLYIGCAQYMQDPAATHQSKLPVFFLPMMYGVHAALMLKGGL